MIARLRDVTHDDGSALFARLLEFGPERDPAAALTLGEASWEQLRTRAATRYDAETCRVLAIAASLVADYSRAEVWRARALVRFAALGWLDGVATVVMSEALARLSRDNDDYVRGRTLDVITPSLAASDMVATLEPIATSELDDDELAPLSDWSPKRDLTKRLFWEKGGFMLLLLRRYDDARASYASAAAVARPGRGELKVAAAALLVEYLAARDGQPARIEGEAVLTEQRRIIVELGEARGGDLLPAARRNLEVMERGGDDLEPYEIL